MNRRGFVKSTFATVLAGFLSFACDKQTTLDLLEGIVGAAEAVLPSLVGVTGLSPDLIMQITAYINIAMEIVSTLTGGPITTASLQRAIVQFQTDAIPAIPVTSPVRGLIFSLSQAISIFVTKTQQQLANATPTQLSAIRAQAAKPNFSKQQVMIRTRAMAVRLKIS